MIAMTLMLALSSPALPSGDRLAPQEACFTIDLTRDGQTRAFGQVRQSVRRATLDGEDVLRVLVHQVGQGGFDMRDSFVLDAKTLQPIHFENVRNGKKHVVLDYSADRVQGSKTGSGGVAEPIDVALPQPVWEGNLFGVMFAALPLAPRGQYRVPSYQYDKGLGEFIVRVKGTESVSTPDGPVDAWVLDAGTDEAHLIEYLVARENPRELGYRAQGFSQLLGGDCSAIPPADQPPKPMPSASANE